MKRGWYKNKETGDVVFVEGVSPAAGQKHFKTGRTVEVPE